MDFTNTGRNSMVPLNNNIHKSTNVLSQSDINIFNFNDASPMSKNQGYFNHSSDMISTSSFALTSG